MGILDVNIGDTGAGVSFGTNTIGTIFTCGSTGILDQVDFYLYKYAGITDDVYFELWNHANGVPTSKIQDLGVILAGSVPTSYVYASLQIPAVNRPSVSSGQQYCIMLYARTTSGSAYATNFLATTANKGNGIYKDGKFYGFAGTVFVDGKTDRTFTSGITEGYILSNNSYHAFLYKALSTGIVTTSSFVVYLYAGATAGINFRMYDDNNGSVGSLMTGGELGRIPSTSLDQNYSTRFIYHSTGPSVTAGSSYWYVIWKDNSSGGGNVAVQLDYSAPQIAMVSSNSGSTWSYNTCPFKTYVAAASAGPTTTPIELFTKPTMGFGL